MDPIEQARSQLATISAEAAKVPELARRLETAEREIALLRANPQPVPGPMPIAGDDRAMIVRNAAPNGLIRLASRFDLRGHDDPRDNAYGLLDEPLRAPGEAPLSHMDMRSEASEWQWELRRLKTIRTMAAGIVRAYHQGRHHMPFPGDPTPKTTQRILRHIAMGPPEIRDQLTRAFSDTSGAGGELIDDQRLPLFDDTLWRQPSGIEAMFPRFAVSTRAGTLPRLGDGIVAYITGQATSDDPAKFTASMPKTSSVSYATKRLTARIAIDADAAEDSFINIIEAYINAGLRSLGLIREHAIINGAAAGGQDAASWNPAGIYGDTVPALIGTAADPIRMFNGLRYDALSGASNSGAGTDPCTYASLLALASKVVGAFANKRFILGTKHQHKVSALDQFATVEKFGARASNIAGLVGGIGSIPVLASDLLTDDLNASGVYDGVTTTKTGVICVDPTAYAMVDRRATTAESQYDATRGVVDLVMSSRLDMIKQAAASRDTVRYDYNISPT